MTELHSLDGPPDLDALDTFLISEGSPPDCMQLSELDGFLTGVAIGPELLQPGQYMPTIWGDEEPEFADADEAAVVVGAILARYNEILVSIETGDFQPIFWADPQGEPVAGDWADGFVAAISLDPDAWEPLVRDEEGAVLLLPIMSLASGDDGRPLIEGVAGDDDDLDGYLAEAPQHISTAVEEIAAFWRARRKAAANA